MLQSYCNPRERLCQYGKAGETPTEVEERLNQQLVTFMLLIHEKITRQMENAHKDVLTTSQFLMVAMVQNYGSMPMSALAARMNIQKQHATKIVNQLVQLGYLERIPDPKDRRVIRVGLTQVASDFMMNCFIESMKTVSRSMAALDEREFEELQASIETLNRILPHVTTGRK